MNEAALRERVEYLEAENAELRRQLRGQADDSFVAALRQHLGVRPTQARLLWALWDCRQRSTQAIHEAMYQDRPDAPFEATMKVHLHGLRRALSKVPAEIKTMWGCGYQLLPADRAKIAAHIGIEVQP